MGNINFIEYTCYIVTNSPLLWGYYLFFWSVWDIKYLVSYSHALSTQNWFISGLMVSKCKHVPLFARGLSLTTYICHVLLAPWSSSRSLMGRDWWVRTPAPCYLGTSCSTWFLPVPQCRSCTVALLKTAVFFPFSVCCTPTSLALPFGISFQINFQLSHPISGSDLERCSLGEKSLWQQMCDYFWLLAPIYLPSVFI